jgi:hypothetical protein
MTGARGRSTERTPVHIGAVLVALYAVTAALTATWAPGGMRPLFDGFGSHPGQYNWVSPPREFAEGNQPPESATAGVVMGAEGSEAASVAPNDGQALAALPPKALAPHPPDTAASLSMSPVDPAKVAPLPPGLRAEGNAYRIRARYEPSDTDATLAVNGTVGLTSVAPAPILLYSPDGKTWERKVGAPLSQGVGLTGTLEQPGWYLAASEGEPRPLAGGSGGGGAPVVLYVVLAVVPLVLAWFLLGRRARPAGGAGRGTGGRRPAGTGPAAGARGQAGKRPPGKGGGAKGGKGKQGGNRAPRGRR